MTVPTLPGGSGSKSRRTGTGLNGDYGTANSDSSKARLFLIAACLWPLFILSLLASSAPHVTTDRNGLTGRGNAPLEAVGTGIDEYFHIQNILDRVDILGYGPTHPRVAVVIVGDDKDNLVTSLESVFQNTDMNRIFIVCVVVDGHEEDESLRNALVKIDTHGNIPHWHGDRPDLHAQGQKQLDDDDPHGKKVHVIFNPNKLGISESRADAIQFIEILQKHHEDAGLKSPHEDILLLLLQSGALLTSKKWLPSVTQALIVPPPILGREDPTVAMKLANAVSFNLEGSGKRTSFDTTFAAKVTEATAAELSHSSGASWPTPALNGAAIAMRLETYLNLPSQDTSLRDEWAANIDLSLNLWLCADGIDILRGLDVTSFRKSVEAPLSPELAARFAAAWMDNVMTRKFFNAYTKIYKDVTYLEWEKFMSMARETPGFTRGLTKKCRSFRWYIEKVNTDLYPILQESAEIEANDDEEENDEEEDGDKSEKGKDDNDDKDEEGNEAKKEDGGDAHVLAGDADAQKQQIADAVKKMMEEDARKQQAGNEAADIIAAANDADAVKQQVVEAIKKAVAAEGGDGGGEDVSIPERRDDKKKPSKPLCKECLEIVQRAQPIDIKYEDVTGGHKEHPHMGATDADGKFGYIHDEIALRNNPPPFNFDADKLQRECAKHDNNYKMLHDKVFVDLEAHEEAEKSGQKRDKIFCLVYTIDSGHPKIPSIRETWGPKCDGFMVGSNKTDPALGTVNIVHEGPEEYDNIWQKVRSMWSYIYDNYYEKYDWFHIGGDDLYLLVENLRLYLESEEIRTAANGGMFLPDGTESHQTPLFLGRRFAYQGDMEDIFNSGGSGYTLNKAALKTLVVLGFPKYWPHMKTFSEDTMVARTFRKFGVFPYETKDEAGGERYMPFMPGHHYGYRMPQDHSKDWYARYSINIKEGLDHCAARSVAFHYVKGDAMYRMHALLYHLCPTEQQ